MQATETLPAFDPGERPAEELELIDADEACRLLGGSRPLNKATLYRGVAAGRFPRPIKIGMSSRWVKAELLRVLKTLIAERDGAAA